MHIGMPCFMGQSDGFFHQKAKVHSSLETTESSYMDTRYCVCLQFLEQAGRDTR